ncbi:MAG TPA: acyltransferase [Planctomycetaceae bacterium]|jgi:peptidoglycan/LPS O-acetylase OafA/YrhL|nr:acyltransferase [Planctomycetaceae bacterium]
MQQPQRGFEGRSTFVDALRGIAALSVACYHIFRYGPLPEPASRVVPGILQVWFDHGWIGVQVFFVISGFVIAYSVRNVRITPGYVANYALRRSIRLDPPYWSTILLVLLVHWVFHLHLGFDSPMDVPSPMETPLTWMILLSHVLYLQNILGFENLSAGFWTLCIEVQFYLMYVIGLGVAQHLSHRSKAASSDVGAVPLLALFAPLAILSLFAWNSGLGSELWRNAFASLGLDSVAAADPGQDYWITHFFCMFFLGSAAWWALDRRVPPIVFWGYVGLMAVRLGGEWIIVRRWSLDLTIALIAGIAIYLLGRRGRLGTTLNYRWLQYLGRISYSLYLIHFPVAHVVTTLGYEHMTLNRTLAPWAAAAWLLAALVASIAAAHLLYTFVEAPSVRLASRLKPKPSPAR